MRHRLPQFQRAKIRRRAREPVIDTGQHRAGIHGNTAGPQSIPTNRRQTSMGNVALEPNFNSNDEAYGVIRAYNPQNLEPVWEFNLGNITWGGVVSTEGDLVFGGGSDAPLFTLPYHSPGFCLGSDHLQPRRLRDTGLFFPACCLELLNDRKNR